MTSVSVRLPARALTLDDVSELASSDPDHRYELQEGNLLIMPPAELDRHLKPVEYARARIPHFWRVERDGPATVHAFRLGTGASGEPVYVGRQPLLLDDLLAGPVPDLGS